MAVFDTESFIFAVRDVVQANLAAQIDAIDAEKGDWTLPKIAAKAWYFQNLDDRVFSYPHFVVYGLDNQPDPSDITEEVNLNTVRMFFEVVVADTAGPISENVFRKLLRYTRALEASVQKNSRNIRSGTKIRVENQTPTSFMLDGKMFRTAGIVVAAALTTN